MHGAGCASFKLAGAVIDKLTTSLMPVHSKKLRTPLKDLATLHYVTGSALSI